MWDITGDTFPMADNPSFSPAAETIAPELPSYDPVSTTGGTTSAPLQVATGTANMPAALSGILQPVTATAEALLKTWGIFNGVQQSVSQTRLQQEIARSDIAIRAAETKDATALKQIQSAANVRIAELQAQAAIDKASNEAAAAKNGGVVYVAGQGGMSLTTILGFAAVGLAAWKLFRGKK